MRVDNLCDFSLFLHELLELNLPYYVSIFLHGFEKNESENISEKEEDALKDLTESYYVLSNREIQVAIEDGELIEVKNE